MKRRVLFLSGRETGYPRNRVLVKALRSAYEVDTLTVDIPTTIARSAAGLARFIVRRGEYDACFAGFYGQPLAIALSKIQRRPIILDAYVSTFDTLCADRGWFNPGSAGGRAARWLDVQGCRVARLVLTDTRAHAAYFAAELGVDPDKLAPVYVGCDEDLFYPRERPADSTGCINIFYYGAFLRLHGADAIVQAAALLRDRPEIRFTLGGDGPLRSSVRQLATDLGLENVEFVGWIPYDEVPSYIARADICLGGHYSTVDKAARVIPTKAFQCIAMRKPTILGDSDGTRELFVHSESAWLVRMGDPRSLAAGVAILADDKGLRHHIAANGRRVFEERLSAEVIAAGLAMAIDGVL
jgi:glycosyltransferase involved in cell wall biosynthesis